MAVVRAVTIVATNAAEWPATVGDALVASRPRERTRCGPTRYDKGRASDHKGHPYGRTSSVLAHQDLS